MTALAVWGLLNPATSFSQSEDDAAPGVDSAQRYQQSNPPAAPLPEEPDPALDTSAGAAFKSSGRTSNGQGGVNREVIVRVGKDAELKAQDTAETIIVIGGSARVRGKVRDTVVVIGGDAEVDGEVQNEVVTILGNLRVNKGGKLHGDAVAVGGRISVAEGATVHGLQEVDFPGPGFPPLHWLRNWLGHCGVLLRPLAPQVGWAWGIALGFFLVYVFIAAVFPRPVAVCVEELNRRPATTFLMGLLTKLLVPLVILILAITGVGLVVVPFVLAALFLGGLVGKTAILEWIGLALGRQSGRVQKPLVALAIGAAIVALLYMVPVLGLVTFAVLSLWGLGAVVMAAFGGLRREMPDKPVPVPPGTAGDGRRSGCIEFRNSAERGSSWPGCWPNRHIL